MKYGCIALLFASLSVNAAHVITVYADEPVYQKTSCYNLQKQIRERNLDAVNEIIQQGINEYHMILMTEEKPSEVARVNDLLAHRAPNLHQYVFTYCAKNLWMDIPGVMKVGVYSNFSK